MIHLRLLRLIGPSAGLLVAVVGAGLLSTGVAVAQAVAAAGLFSGIVSGRTLDALAPSAAVFAAALLVRPMLSLARELAVHGVAGRVKVHLRTRILDAEIAAGPLARTSGRSGERQSLLVDAVENLEPYIGRYLPQVVVTAVTGVSLVVALFAIDPVIGVVVGAVSLLVPFLPRLWDAALAGRGEEHWGAYSALHADVVDSIRGMPTLKALGAASRRRSQLAAAGESLLSATLSQLRLSLVESGLTGFFLVAGPVVALLTGTVRVTSGALAPEALFLVTMLSFEVFRPFRDLANHWHAGYAGVSAGSRILSLVEEAGTPPRLPASQATDRPVTSSTSSRGAVHASTVSFRYPGAETTALDDVSLDVPSGSFTAIVGASGSGKSTFASLLLGLAEPDTGEVLLEGTSTSTLGQTGSCGLVSIVSQDPVLFAGTVRDNLLLVAPGATDAQLVAALRDANADEFLDTDRGGLDAPVGDNGGLLSGGQRQRLAIARALLRDTPILLLDEASSALDARREHAILHRIRTTTRPDGSPRTIIVIAHRLASVQDADQVIVFESGHVVESGSYQELLDRRGALSRLHDAQMNGVLS